MSGLLSLEVQGFDRLLSRLQAPNARIADAVAAETAGAMLMRGTRTKTRQQVQDAFDKLKARVGVSGGAMNATASLEVPRENLAEALALWRGPMLADVGYEGSLRSEIRRLEDLRLAARERLADLRLRRGGHAEALADLQELVAGRWRSVGGPGASSPTTIASAPSS